MLSSIRQFISPPVFADEDKNRKARLLNIMLLTILVGAVIYALMLPRLEPGKLRRLFLVISVIPLVFLLRHLMLEGRIRLASILLVCGMWCIMTLSIATSGGAYSAAADIYVVFIVAAGLLLGGRFGIGLALASIISGLAMLWAGANDVIVQGFLLSPITFWLLQSLTFVAVAVFLYLDADSLQQILGHSRKSEHALAERNQELQLYAGMVERREAALQSSEERYRTLSELISDYAYALDIGVDGEMTLAWITDAFTRITGYDPSIFHSFDGWIHLIVADDIPIVENWAAVSLEGQEHTCDYRISVSGGGTRWLRSYSRPMWNPEHDRVVRIYGAIQDISEQMEAEEEQHRLLTEISRQREELSSLNRRLAETQELERKHLVQELHDQVGQNLTAIALNLNIVKAQISALSLPEGTDHPVRNRMDDTISLVRQTTVQIRSVMADLRPPVLDDYGLKATLDWYATQVHERTGITIHVTHATDISRLPAAVENTLFRIAQEAVTNAVKHADATQISVSLAIVNGNITLTVWDDGRGFAANAIDDTHSRTGWGLLSMQQRAEAVDGRFGVQSQNGEGTVIVVEVPL